MLVVECNDKCPRTGHPVDDGREEERAVAQGEIAEEARADVGADGVGGREELAEDDGPASDVVCKCVCVRGRDYGGDVWVDGRWMEGQVVCWGGDARPLRTIRVGSA